MSWSSVYENNEKHRDPSGELGMIILVAIVLFVICGTILIMPGLLPASYLATISMAGADGVVAEGVMLASALIGLIAALRLMLK